MMKLWQASENACSLFILAVSSQSRIIPFKHAHAGLSLRLLVLDQIRFFAEVYDGSCRRHIRSWVSNMNDKEHYKRTFQAQLDEWSKEIAQLRAKADEARIEARAEMHKRIDELDNKLQEGVTTFAQLAQASDEAWGALLKGGESAWKSLKTSFSEAAAKFKE